MTTTTEQIDLWRQTISEHQRLEFKEAKNQFDHEMDRNDRVRACYQHCALKWATLQPMTNQSFRARFHLGEDKAAIASQVIAATVDAKLIKPDESVRGSRKFARYQPFWA